MDRILTVFFSSHIQEIIQLIDPYFFQTVQAVHGDPRIVRASATNATTEEYATTNQVHASARIISKDLTAYKVWLLWLSFT